MYNFRSDNDNYHEEQSSTKHHQHRKGSCEHTEDTNQVCKNTAYRNIVTLSYNISCDLFRTQQSMLSSDKLLLTNLFLTFQCPVIVLFILKFP